MMTISQVDHDSRYKFAEYPFTPIKYTNDVRKHCTSWKEWVIDNAKSSSVPKNKKMKHDKHKNNEVQDKNIHKQSLKNSHT